MYKTARPKRSVVRDEFVILPEGAKCKHCQRFVRCVQSSNMKKHLRYCQPEIFKIVQEADGNFTYNPSPITMSVMNPQQPHRHQQQYQHPQQQQQQYRNSSSVPFTSDHISSFVESQLASFKYDPMEEDVEEEEPSSSPEEIPGSNQSYIHDIEDDNNDKMDEKALKAFSSFDTVEINNGVKSYECLISQIDPFLISKYFNVPVLSLRLRHDCIVSKPTPDMRKFIPPLIAGKKYQLITEEQANEKITKCRIIIGSESFEMKCAEYNKDLIMGYMETPKDFVLIDGDGIVIEVRNDTDVKLYDGKAYHVVYDKMDILKPPIKAYPMPIEFIAGTSINRSMSLFPPYLICISRAMHILTFIGEKFDLRTSTPNNLIGHTVANHAAQSCK
uniref:Uncharacterized protein n=1 Tax=Panagrolaimus davidi TaxID=227884 RepID=A0A914P4U1_9BILA